MFPTFRNTALAAVAVGLALTGPTRAAPLTYIWDTNASVTFSDGATGNLVGTFTIDPPGTSLSGSSIVLTRGQEAGTYPPLEAFTVDTLTYGFGSGTARTHLGLSFSEDLSTAPQHPLLQGASWAQGAGNSLGDTTGGAHLAASVSEPASLTLLALGLAGLGVVLRTRRAGAPTNAVPTEEPSWG